MRIDTVCIHLDLHAAVHAAEIATPTPTVDPTDAAILNAYDQALRARRLDQRLHLVGNALRDDENANSV